MGFEVVSQLYQINFEYFLKLDNLTELILSFMLALCCEFGWGNFRVNIQKVRNLVRLKKLSYHSCVNIHQVHNIQFNFEGSFVIEGPGISTLSLQVRL